jgi:hypothetical protein
MHVLTFFDDKNLNTSSLQGHKDVLDLWKYSWEYHGFKAVVVRYSDLQNTDNYYDLLLQISKINFLNKKKRVFLHNSFETSVDCEPLYPPALNNHYLKWLACSQTFNDNKQAVYSDYSLLNIKFGIKNTELYHDKKYIKFLNGSNANLFSFNKDSAARVLNSLYKICDQYKSKIKLNSRQQILDNDIFNLIPTKNYRSKKHKILFSNTVCSHFSLEEDLNSPVYEFSFYNLNKCIHENSKYYHYDPIVFRRDLMEQYLINAKMKKDD